MIFARYFFQNEFILLSSPLMQNWTLYSVHCRLVHRWTVGSPDVESLTPICQLVVKHIWPTTRNFYFMPRLWNQNFPSHNVLIYCEGMYNIKVYLMVNLKGFTRIVFLQWICFEKHCTEAGWTRCRNWDQREFAFSPGSLLFNFSHGLSFGKNM